MSGLFATFNVAKRGMFVQQKALDVTSHNIANANTEGYSRQRAIIQTTRPFGMPSLNNEVGPGQLGTGSEIEVIQRVRDEFLDYRVRTETSTYGQYKARDTFLNEVECVLNEPSDTGISNLIGKFFDSWQQLSKQPHSSNARTVVAQQSVALTDELNHTYNQLEKLRVDSQTVIKNSVFEVNNILDQIDTLNQQIISVKVSGMEPNDLMDKRDLLIDELSLKFGVEVDKCKFYGNDIKPLAEGNVPDNCNLVQSLEKDDVKRFAYISSIEEYQEGKTKYKVIYYINGDMSSEDNKRTITMENVTEDQYKEIDQCRVIWTDKDGNCIDKEGNSISRNEGEISYTNLGELMLFKPIDGELKGYMSVQEDINDYMDQLNRLAKALAFSVNALHSGKEKFEEDKMPFFVNKDGLEENITAGNITVNEQILNDVMQIKTREHDDQFDYAGDNDIDGESDGSRALAIAQLRDKLIAIQNINAEDGIKVREDMFDNKKGGNTLNGLEFTSNTNGMKVDDYFKDTIDRLGVQRQEAVRIVGNQYKLLYSLSETKESVSGVSLDEEIANLIQFQHAYQANAKIIATVDQLLDVVVNGLKR